VLDGGDADASPAKRQKVQPPKSASPAAVEVPQRRASTASVDAPAPPPKKRQRTMSTHREPSASATHRESSASATGEDRLRKHVLDEFQKLFAKIFQAYPHAAPAEAEAAAGAATPVEKKWDEMADEERTAVGEAANAYATDAEGALHELCGDDRQKFK
jgi:hypothetical protein